MTTNLIKRDVWDLDPFDLLWKNLFEEEPRFNTLVDKINYPVDIYEEEDGITFELAVVGIEKDDLEIQVQGENLRITYSRPESEKERYYIYKGIARRSFDLAWKVSSKFNLSKLEASMEKGLLKIYVPITEDKKPKLIEIKTIK
jgi:HSP20 family protein